MTRMKNEKVLSDCANLPNQFAGLKYKDGLLIRFALWIEYADPATG